jgi:hypothetical protein
VSAGPAVPAAQVVSVGPAELGDQEELAGLGESADREELAGQEVSDVQGELAGLGELGPTGQQDHLLGHTIHLKLGRTREQSRVSRRQAPFLTIQDWGTRTEIWRKTSRVEMGMRHRPIGWHPTDPQLRIAPTIRSEDLATPLIPRVHAMEHSVVINPVVELKPRATGGDQASAAAGLAGAVEAEVVAAAAAVEVVEAAVGVAAAVDDVASWRFGPPRGPSQSEAVKRNREKNRD